MSKSHPRAVKIDGIEYFSVSLIFRKNMLPSKVIGSLCSDPRYCRYTGRNKLMIRADAVWLLNRHGTHAI
jgi:hypothetical protein